VIYENDAFVKIAKSSSKKLGRFDGNYPILHILSIIIIVMRILGYRFEICDDFLCCATELLTAVAKNFTITLEVRKKPQDR